ncbi:hypothetical protein JTB14_003441 [Gonioctena quinquepunctata]|nr:hypothetical protein JTB14_003441 [Gonioctena quinquepunctata]
MIEIDITHITKEEDAFEVRVHLQVLSKKIHQAVQSDDSRKNTQESGSDVQLRGVRKEFQETRQSQTTQM